MEIIVGVLVVLLVFTIVYYKSEITDLKYLVKFNRERSDDAETRARRLFDTLAERDSLLATYKKEAKLVTDSAQRVSKGVVELIQKLEAVKKESAKHKNESELWQTKAFEMLNEYGVLCIKYRELRRVSEAKTNRKPRSDRKR